MYMRRMSDWNPARVIAVSAVGSDPGELLDDCFNESTLQRSVSMPSRIAPD
jgi:hypothetical protein